MKNRAQVEGPICQAYILKEISNFYSYYCEPYIQSKRTRIGNDDGGESSNELVLSVFNQPGHAIGNAKTDG